MTEKSAIYRVKQFLKHQGISEQKFLFECGLPEGSFKWVKSIGSENLKKIALIYCQLNLDWVVTGRGEMLIKDKSERVYPAQNKKEPELIMDAEAQAAKLAIEALKDMVRDVQADLIKCFKEKEALKKQIILNNTLKDPEEKNCPKE